MSALISVDDVTVRYPLKGGGTHTVFSGLNLAIDEGEFICVVGQTGCGKSTLLRLILGSEHPLSGEVRMGDRQIREPNRERGYVPQKCSLFPDKTVLENVAFGPSIESFRLHRLLSPSWWKTRKDIREESSEYLRRVGLSAKDARKYPDQLSGGMQQRVSIAQSLIMRPRILLMDEAFSALDPTTRTDMQRLTRSIWKDTQTTFLFVTHNLQEAIFLGSRVILIAKDNTADHSCIACDMQIPDNIRRPDGYPKQDELDCVIRQLERAAIDRKSDEVLVLK